MRAEFSLDYDVLTLERPQKLYLMAQFVAGVSLNSGQRRPLNLSLVIDRSGSMAGAKMDYTRQAAQFLVQHLSPMDTLSIVLYSDKVETIVAPERVVNKDAIAQKLERIRASGTTNLSAGWLEGCQNVARHLSAETLDRVILMSDGLANRGVTDKAQLVALAQQKYGEGVSTTTMGLGNDFNEDLLMDIANGGGGAFYFIESPEVAPEIFKEELRGLLSVVGQNLTIAIATTSQVTGVRQLNAYPTHMDGKHTSYRLGDIFAEEVKALVLELSIPSLSSLGEQQIATLRFEYDDITNNTTHHQVLEMPVMIKVKASGELSAPQDGDVVQAVLLLQAANARQEAVKSADVGDYLSASQVLKSAALAIQKSGVQSSPLLEEEKVLLSQAQLMEQGAGAYNDYSRKSMSTQAYYTQTNRHEDTVMLRAREINRQTKNLSEEPPPPLSVSDVPTAIEPIEEAVPYQPDVTPTHVAWRGSIFELLGDVIRIGRSSHNEIVIDETGVSRFHAQLRRDGGGLLVEDLGSTNGTMVGGERLTVAYRLSVGDVVYLCDEKLIFRLGKTN